MAEFANYGEKADVQTTRSSEIPKKTSTLVDREINGNLSIYLKQIFGIYWTITVDDSQLTIVSAIWYHYCL